MKLLPPTVALSSALTRGRAPLPAGPAAPADEAPAPIHDAREPDWRSAYQRRRLQDDEPVAPEVAPSSPPACHVPPREKAAEPVVPVRAAAPATATTVRIDALRQLAEPAPVGVPVPRVWQVELPAAGAGWQLRVEQAQPQAPLNLELRVPPLAQAQGRQQLGELDKRLREAGHDVLRPRLRDEGRARRSRPVDGVEP